MSLDIPQKVALVTGVSRLRGIGFAICQRLSLFGGGRIISLSSGQSLGPMPDELPYAMTKGAMDIFTRHFAAEVGVKGITVNAVNPGPTDTGWMNAEIEAELLPRSPSRRMGLPQDAAKLIAFLASEEAEWITGRSFIRMGALGEWFERCEIT